MLGQLKGRDIDIWSLCPTRIRDGRHMSFWKDIWMGEEPLATNFHRIHALDTFRRLTVNNQMSKAWDMTTLRHDPRSGVKQEQSDGLLTIAQNIQLQSIPDSSTRGFIDGTLLFTGGEETIRNNWFPIKINILIWRIQLLGIPITERLPHTDYGRFNSMPHLLW